MHRYITSAHGHELRGNVRAYAYIIIMPGLNVRELQSKLLITPLSEGSHNIIIQQVCSLKSVTTTLSLLSSYM